MLGSIVCILNCAPCLNHSLNTFLKPVLYVLYFKDCVHIATVLIWGGVYQFYPRQKCNKQWWTLREIWGMPASYPGAVYCSMACVAFAWIIWLIVTRRCSTTKRLGTRQKDAQIRLLKYFHCQKFPAMTSLDKLQVSFPLFFASKIHLLTSYPESLRVEKLIKVRFFTARICYMSS
jgi:hypothetical protein